MEIFTTDNPQFGWDGTYKGVPVQDGNYVYQIEYINGVGVSTKKINVVTLVR